MTKQKKTLREEIVEILKSELLAKKWIGEEMEGLHLATEKIMDLMSEERFCCWCGKVENTRLCQSPSLKRVVKKIAKHILNEKETKGA